MIRWCRCEVNMGTVAYGLYRRRPREECFFVKIKSVQDEVNCSPWGDRTQLMNLYLNNGHL